MAVEAGLAGFALPAADEGDLVLRRTRRHRRSEHAVTAMPAQQQPHAVEKGGGGEQRTDDQGTGYERSAT
ncbi:MAG: hypothetical protein HYS27_09640 [Deltaproteobacteria bacterium]|nr:hypothetical protein [Deltaproteobacteria bacterium]